MAKMNFVIQEDRTGCGIAGAATLAGVSYQIMKRKAARLGITPENNALWTSIQPMQHLVTTLGFQISKSQQPFVDWAALPSTALLAIKWHIDINGPAWHWVVFKRDANDAYVLDPKRALKSNIRRDFGRMKPKWFLMVH